MNSKAFSFFIVFFILLTFCADQITARAQVVQPENVATNFFPIVQTANQYYDEIEPNEYVPQYLPNIGYKYYVKAAINYLGDVDLYSFDVISGRSYVIEVFDANQVFSTEGNYCSNSYKNYSGLALVLNDPSNYELIKDCQAQGSGDVHHIIAFTATRSGRYVVRVFPNSDRVTGEYKLRILPKHNQPYAEWDAKYEPNNHFFNAAEITPGLSNAIFTDISWRTPEYSTYYVDVDFYRFYAYAGKSYHIELFDVMSTLGANNGVRISSYDPNLNNISYKFTGDGGNVHAYIAYTATMDGWFYIIVEPTSPIVSGTYGLRVLPKFNEPGAEWDTETHESNNSPFISHSIDFGSPNSIRTSIEMRDSQFATISADKDYFHFNASQGESYTVNVFNVDDSLDGGTIDCHPFWEWTAGLQFYIFGPNFNKIYASCEGMVNDYIQYSVTFRASATGPHYFLLIPNNQSDSGSYSVEVIHNE